MVERYKQYIPFLVMIILAVLAFLIIKPFLVAIIIGALLAYLSYQFYTYLLLKTGKASISAFIVCVIAFLIVVIPSFYFIKVLVQQSYALFILGKQKLATGFLIGCTSSMCETLNMYSNDPAIAYQIQEVLRGTTNWVVEKGSNFLLGVPQIVIGLFISFVSMYYFLKDGNRFVQKANRFFSTNEEKYGYVLSRLKRIMHGIVYGYGLVAVIQGILGGFGFFIFGVSSPVFWGMVVGILGLFPLIGSAIVWGPAALMLILQGIFQNSNSMIARGVGLAIYSALLISSLDNTLKPKLMGQKAKVHPGVMMIGLIGGVFFFGPIGVILGPLTLALLIVLFDAYIMEKKLN
ncbi:AI-2E family transporter [Candidatus Woesearchaeota archaeon]|nr:AI-2E family transporter [Candidatus Woesearchaeota archaeon]